MEPVAGKTHLRWVVLALVATSLAVFAVKVFVLGFPLLPHAQSETWDVEARVSFLARGRPVKARLHILPGSDRYAVIDESFVSRGYGINTASPGGNRQVTWAIRGAQGRQALYYRATVRPAPGNAVHSQPAGPMPQKPEFAGIEAAAARSLIDDARARSADPDTFVSALVQQVTAVPADQRVRVLLGRNPQPGKDLMLAARLLTFAGVPARVAHGVRLTDLERSAPLVDWLQFLHKGRWHYVSSQTGVEQTPRDFLPWWYGDRPFVQVSGANRVETSVAVARGRETALGGATEQGLRLMPKLFGFSLFTLPIETQAVYHVLLLVPVGAFILVLMRNVVGFKTFGTFMPVLIALAFRQTELLWGIVLFSAIVALGLTVRFYLERLKLLLVPRLAAVLIVVVLLMAALSVLSHRLGLPQGLSVALFPMVILTMTIERMSIVWEERGAFEALQEGSGSLAVAALAYLVINQAWLQHLVFVFPELLLLLLAAVLLLGRYTGYRLLELRRFRALARDESR
ncbi:MAG TPA: inactive transglutaminase family protein [Gammaproteobacteria bacterium]|nr:inactive transglutaminase family protein [Gammaproteobacteria bacterium]